MKAKKIPLILVTTIIALIWCSSAWADRSNIRDNRQTQRIHQGIRSNEITRPEVRILKNDQRHIDRAYHGALADGRLNWRERQRLEKMQDHASRDIYRAKHNNVRQRHAVVHKHTINRYYPVINTGHADGYEFSVGLSDIGWQFAFSGWNR
jgi:hypothetical protein